MALLGDLTLEMVQAASLVSAYFGLQGRSRLRFSVFFDELPVGNAVVLATGESEIMSGLVAGKDSTFLVDNPNDADNSAKLLVIAAATPEDLLRLRSVSPGEINRGGALPANRSEYRPYEAPRWVKSEKAIRLSDLTAGTELVLEGTSRATQAVSFRLAPDLFAEPTQSIPLVIDYRVSIPAGAPLPELVVELNHHFIGRLPVPGSAQRPTPNMLALPSIQANSLVIMSFESMPISVPTKGCDLSGPVLLKS